MSGQRGIEDAVNTTIRCASAKILTALDEGADKDAMRSIVLRELNGIRRFFIKRVSESEEGAVSQGEG